MSRYVRTIRFKIVVTLSVCLTLMTIIGLSGMTWLSRLGSNMSAIYATNVFSLALEGLGFLVVVGMSIYLLRAISNPHDEVDISECKYLQHRMALLDRAVNLSHEAIYVIDEQLTFIYVNDAACRLLGYSRDELLGMTPFDIDPDITPEMMMEMKGGSADGMQTIFETRHRASDGRIFPVEISSSQFELSGAKFSTCMVRDITDRKQAQEALYKREQEFRTLVENSPDTIARYDRNCRRVYVNPRMVSALGGDMARILGTTPVQFPGGDTAPEYENVLRQVFDQGVERDFELHWQQDDAEFCSHIRVTPEFDRAGCVAHVLSVGRDITEIDQYRQKIRHHAFFDSLTGLPNRELFSDRIAKTIADTTRHGIRFGVMLLDLDNFKEVNDTLGHGAGDRLLCEAAARMQDCVSVYCTVARLGGDEFAVLLPDARTVDELGNTARKIMDEFARQFVVGGRELFVTVSIGIALYPDDSNEGDVLYRYADSAMYRAKRLGRNNFQFYTRELTEHSQERMEIGSALRGAQKNGELVLYYQPQVELASGRVTGAEALIRWVRSGHGMMMPDQFIRIAEDSGLIVDIGQWVLRTACATVAQWNSTQEIPLRMAVNLSTRQFIRNDLAGSLRCILAETGCKAEWLELEITESLLLEDSHEVNAMLSELRGMGLSISIDDFGTGYSALSYLHRFPVGQVKIDRSFVKDISERREKRELVKAILSIAGALHLESVAEGVETSEQANFLVTQGCQLAQGYLFGKPMPRETFDVLLASGRSHLAGAST
ncbi:PAS domain S-box-containing protein/diguanylate cyclase (GGDEF) domain-containing protein [Paraburkholderia phenazinium]|uniref:PAS domain S-box-containing protein/diguanylate cyclase (GGDEF) domain-containing protein n=2 Tax=Paraburkholderia phenazinium TaxID=60549 RepID=A0A1G8ITQ1_9BURK|nr:PAS domain S-box-containing protein/diguanylate cyclase (GGDEF) domain-containing protein [Paraburkholderia phenazinium]